MGKKCGDKAVSSLPELNSAEANGWPDDVSPEDISYFPNVIFLLMPEQWSQLSMSEDKEQYITKCSARAVSYSGLILPLFYHASLRTN